MDIEYYEILNVTRTASDEEIKRSYRKLAVKHHPDKGGDIEKFKSLSMAYEVLSNPEKRELYDRFGKNMEPSGPQMTNMNDIFGAMFRDFTRTQKPQVPRGPDMVHSLSLSLEDIFTGKKCKVAVTKNVICQGCSGIGGSVLITCRQCNGRGTIVQIRNIGIIVQHVSGVCPCCMGEGRSVDANAMCTQCKGAKTTMKKKVIDFDVPPGVVDGHQIILDGEANQKPGTLPGNIIVVVQYQPHSLFTLKGKNLFMTRKISLSDALCGHEFFVTHLDGRQISVRTIDIVKPGEVKVIPGEGMSGGDLHITFEVSFPANKEELSSLGKKLLELELNLNKA